MYPWSWFWRTRAVISNSFTILLIHNWTWDILKKDGSTENGGVDSEIGDIGNSAHIYTFPGRAWEELSRNLLSLVKLYQRIWIWNLDQNLIVAVYTILFQKLTRQEICNFSLKMFKMILNFWKWFVILKFFN